MSLLSLSLSLSLSKPWPLLYHPNNKIKKKKKKKDCQILNGVPCAPPTPQFPTTHLTNISTLLTSHLSSSHLFSFFSFHLNSRTPLAPSHSPISTHSTPPSFFWQNYRKNFLGTFASSHLLIEVKISNIFGRFIYFC